MPDIDTQQLALRADENLRAFSTAWASACDGNVWTNGDLLAATSGAPTRAYNQMFVVRPPADLLGSLRELREHIEKRGVQARLRALESLAIDEDVLATAGFVRDGGIPTLSLQPIDDKPSGPSPDIRPVTDEASLAQLVELVSASFEFPEDVLARVFTPRLLDNASWHGYVAYVEGAPAATSTLFVNDRVAGIYYVGTLAAYRERGLGEAVTRRCIIDGAAAGCDMASLQASPEGLPIYERMGFRHVGYYRSYIPKE
jgi:ribosomal protein S18 acetylase RimI-like enzyme